ncbi:helix-turn-helix transcriptional regulator [Sulfitobacter dubius]|uniref:helix-turn-helix transcriptional regulator n=1 Tax=Sulfitobacter dubius TaxID=218673 RepID=UPI0008DFC7F9|nr:helix-turn-helix domain-containing protein [Sulfitobacter dubius]SFH21197.1 transcriptional regulator, AlpA family [Sulfitobacter dubius]
MDRPEYVPAHVARREILGVSEMTVWRWRQDPSLGFPSPVRIRNRLYFRADELRDWMETQRAVAA